MILEIIQKYLVSTDSVSELEFNNYSSIHARVNGKRTLLPEKFQSESEYNNEIIKLVKEINPYFDEATDRLEYLQEGRLNLSNRNVARAHIVLPPASDCPIVTIAKKTTSLVTLDDIYNNNSMSTKMKNFMKAAIDAKLTTVFVGSTGSGKTTFLEAISKLIPMETRIGVVEDSPELQLIQNNVVYLHSMPWRPGMNPNNEVTLDWCVKQINRMRTDLLIIGETRGKEFYQFLMGANSGMDGSMTTLHANSPKAALEKMAQFCMEAQTVPMRVINKLIAGTVDIIVQLDKTVDGEYKTTGICEVSRILGNDEDATIATTMLTEYDKMNKTWNDKFLISDPLRNKLILKGYDCGTFLKKGQSNLDDDEEDLPISKNEKSMFKSMGIPNFKF